MEKPVEDVTRVVTIKLQDGDHKRLVQACKIDNFMTLQEYGERAILYFLNSGKIPPVKK